MKVFINIKNNGVVETVDEFSSYREARKMRQEYQLADSYNLYYISQRCTNEWRES